MRNRQFILSFLLFFYIGLMTVGLTNLIIDPVFHYHAPLKRVSYFLNKERYQNIGILRHFDYDAVVTGTSMAENCRSSQVDELFNVNSVKTCIMGSTYRELSDNIRAGLETHPGCRIVICSLDLEYMLVRADSHISDDPYSSFKFPQYLYDDNMINDAEYLFNLTLFGYSVKDLIMTFGGKRGTSFDEYTSWDDETLFGKDVVLASFSRPQKLKGTVAITDEDRKMLLQNLEKNVIGLADDYPNTTFYFWIPPYSICYYDVEKCTGMLGRELDALEYEMELLTAVDNIRLFSFIDRYDIVTDLSNYKDYGHYRPEVNSEIIRWLAEGDGRITSDNYKEYMNGVRSFYLNYDYDSIYE